MRGESVRANARHGVLRLRLLQPRPHHPPPHEALHQRLRTHDGGADAFRVVDSASSRASD